MTPPDFWTDPGAWQGRMLSPLSGLYDVGRRLRNLFSTPGMAQVPVLCVGNITVGGTGKTPTVRALAQMVAEMGHVPVVSTRGYGGSLAGPVLVDPEKHTANDVGDEPLLLAKTIPVWKAQNRSLGVMAAGANGDLVIMDDGKQNPTVYKTATVVVVDSGAGFGNGRLLPAGPLREPLAAGLKTADVIVQITDPLGRVAGGLQETLRRSGVPLVQASLVPSIDLPPQSVEALAGIGRPQKVYDTLNALGFDVHKAHSFADHHPYTRAELERILGAANGPVVTTEKDMVRIPADLRDHFTVLTVMLQFEDAASIYALLSRLVGSTSMSDDGGRSCN